VGGVISLVVLGVAAGSIWAAFWAGPQPYSFYDINSYRDAVRAVVAGASATYDVLPYPPFVFLLLWFLAVVPPVLGDQLWTIGSLAILLIVSLVLSARAMEASGQHWRLDRWGLVIWASANAVLLVISFPVSSQLTNGQLSLLVLALAFVDTAGLLPRRFQGVLVGLSGAIKVTPLIFVLYYLVTGQRRQAAVAMGSFGLFTMIGWAVFPAGSLQFWTRVGGSSQFGDPARPDNLSIHSALARISPQLGQQTWLWVLLGVVVIVAALWRARQHFLRGERMESLLTVGAAATVVAPIAWPHYFVWLPMVALWLVMTGSRRARWFGYGIYLVYSMMYAMVIMPVLYAANALLLRAVDLLVLIPMLIGLLGLPTRTVDSGHGAS